MKKVRNISFSAVCALVLAVASFFSSCGSEPRPQPPVMEEGQFVDFLTDAYLLEGFYAFESKYRFDTLQPEMIASYDSLLARHGISEEVFDTTVSWYTRHPEIYQRVHDSVMLRLTPGE